MPCLYGFDTNKCIPLAPQYRHSLEIHGLASNKERLKPDWCWKVEGVHTPSSS